MKKVKTFAVAAAVVMALKLAAAAEPPKEVPCPLPSEVEGKILNHDQKVDLGRRVLTRCKAFSEQARYMSVHGYFAWLIQQSAEKLDDKTIRALRDDAQGAFKVAFPDWKKEKASRTRSGVYHGKLAVLTYQFAAAEAKKMGRGQSPQAVVAPSPSAPRPAPRPAPPAAQPPRRSPIPPPPAPVVGSDVVASAAAPSFWDMLVLRINKPSFLANWNPETRRPLFDRASRRLTNPQPGQVETLPSGQKVYH